MQSFPMGRSAGARLFHGGLSEKIEVIVEIKNVMLQVQRARFSN
ncbi:hypothetical protein [Leptospira borgpetersenii]|nr:hypothetical protein [Leptospira borgpetersenii]MDQ7244022.1 hypothetical protein [Leptospira borgpetersenii]UVD71917.1 hypothetical protein NU962_08300 [Leptospira borgpetersenii]UVD75099.1 hypothetical protein LIX27_08335 [Leptospira borgpetersenii]UZW31654.1 hypothetical protein OR565_08325 [Leptospira borgpetersenii]